MEWSLVEGELLTLQGTKEGMMLRCLRGTVWLTRGDGRDYLLYGGSSFQLSAGVTAVIEALGEAELKLEPARSEATGEVASFTLRHCRTMNLIAPNM